jgi:hypothetical protein
MGVLEKIHDALREGVRVAEGREPTPSARIADSQSVKTMQEGGSRARSVMMLASISKGASVTSLSTRSA